MSLSLKESVSNAFNQSACEHNSSQSGKSCVHKPSGGESCAFDGAYIVLNPIRNAAHLVHGGITCGAHNYESRGSLSSASKLYRKCFTTDLSELDIVYGSEEKLYNAIIQIHKEFNPPAIFVYQTCIPAMTGEDTEAICKKASLELGIDVVPVIAPGFLGHKNLGNRLAGDALLKYVIGKKDSPEPVQPLSVNIIGEYNIAGDLWHIIDLFNKCGISIVSKITGDADFQEVQHAHQAALNLLVCSRALINIAAGMESSYNTPFLEISFFGLHNTITAFAGMFDYFEKQFPDYTPLLNNARRLIDQTAIETREKLQKYISILKGRKALVYSGGVKSWSMIAALQDLGIEIVGVGIKKAGKTDLDKIKQLAGEDKMVSDTSPANMLRIIRETGADFLIAGSRNQYLAYKELIPYIDINQERESTYIGFDGTLNLARDLANTLKSPVWEIVKADAPWNSTRKTFAGENDGVK